MNVNAFLNQPASRLLAICASPLFISPVLHYLAIASFGSDIFLFFEIVFLLPSVAAVLTLPVAPFFLFSHQYRRVAARALLASSVLVLAVLVGVQVGWRVRMQAFKGLAERSEPLIWAIRAYERSHGEPPPNLDAVVPEFLPAIPHTGIAAYPAYDYRTGNAANQFDGNPWVVVVFTPSGGINFDQFMYFPRQNYPQTGYGGWLERVADWAYVHE